MTETGVRVARPRFFLGGIMKVEQVGLQGKGSAMAAEHHNYTLFLKTGCPFCAKVMRFMDENGIALRTLDINEWPAAADDLIELGGKCQVPCLAIDGRALYESDDIIAYMKEHLSEMQNIR